MQPSISTSQPHQNSATLDEVTGQTHEDSEYEANYIDAEFISLEGRYVLLVDGTHVKIEAFHSSSMQETTDPKEAEYVLAVVNKLLFGYRIQDLQHTLH